MPELTHDCRFNDRDTTTSYGSVSSSGFWSKRRDDVSYNQLQKFWSELSLQGRQELLRIDKQNLFEQARKNMYCSRCNGLLIEGFMQIIMYGKSLQNEGTVTQCLGNKLGNLKSQTVENTCLTSDCNDDIQDPSVHPWGGLTTTRDGTLTLLDCYIYSKYLKGLQNVFDSARARERERELLYPDACGGGGRGWISQGMLGYGRGHGTRETCALHTARLSVDTLVDFWSALGEETRYSLLRMKEEDFLERLMYRFDNKRFCRDCRKNVVREFKELKELKRLRRETRCTSWFCVADTSFQYEVTHDTVQADWHQSYADSTGIYKYYEWAVGTGEGKSDILEFKNVGSNTKVQMNGLDLTGLNSCYITLRAWRTDGRCNEVSVKAHALKGQNCVHGRLIVGDGFVSITRGESIKRFFEHAEEAEEEEDDDSMDKDGNYLDGECSRPQKHAKSPELAREFLLDAATVIFKEQVEKAFREGTARQNAHSMFVSLALKLLEERVLVACKDIITLEKQSKLLEEEEKEKRDEEERKERRRAKEKEKKLRRKERLRSKELDKEKKCGQQSQTPDVLDANKEELTSVNNEPNVGENTYCEEDEKEEEKDEEEENTLSFVPASEDYTHEDEIEDYDENTNEEFSYKQEFKHPHRRLKSWHNCQLDQQPSKWSDRRRFETSSRNGHFNGVNKPVRGSNGSRYNERLNCYLPNDYRPKVSKLERGMDISKSCFRGNRFNNQTEYVRERTKTNNIPYTKQVWEPRTSQDSDDVIDRSADIIKSVNLIKSPDSVSKNHDNNLKETKSSVQLEADTTSSVSETTDLSSCLSCLSEGDRNTSFSSGPQNSDSSSTSDSECASHHSDVIKETSVCLENDFPEVKNTKDSEVVKKEKSGELSSKTRERNDVIVQPPLQAQSIQFPVFQAPSMGYYRKGPVPWTPLPHPNHFLFTTPFGYEYYHQGMAPPLINHGQLPIYQAVSPINAVKDTTKVVPIKGEVHKTDGIQHGNSYRSLNGNNNNNDDNTGFSLFHFGGPVDLSNGFKPDEVKSCSITSGDSCATDAMEEYNLFSANNGIKFSFF